MYRLLYISTARETIDRALLDNVLAVSRRNNAANGISGLLVAGGKRFLQLLEGDEMKVLETYERIRADPRHYAAVTLREETIADRSFGAWAMGDVAGGNADEGDPAKAARALIAPIVDPTLRAYFSGFVEVQRAA